MMGLVNYSDSDSEEEKISNQKSSSTQVQSGNQMSSNSKQQTTATTTKHLSLSFLPHAIQRALTMGVSAADSDSDSDGNDISSATRTGENPLSRDAGTRVAAGKGTQAPRNSLIAALPKPLNVAIAHDNSNSSNSSNSSKKDSAPGQSARWVLPNSSASWTSTTSTAKTSAVHEPHDASKSDRIQNRAAPTMSRNDGRHLAEELSDVSRGGDADNNDGGLFTLCDPNIRRQSAVVLQMHKPMSMPPAMSSLASADGPESGPDAALPPPGTTEGLTLTSSTVRTMLHDAGSSNASANEPLEEGGRVNRRKREREIEQMIRSGDLSAVNSLGDHVSEANAPAEWDRERYAQRQQAVEKVRRDFNATATDVASLEKNVTLSHKRNHQITALAVQAVAAQLKNVDGSSKRF